MSVFAGNRLEPCGTEACRRWHLSHGRDHVCGVDEPHPTRTTPPPLQRSGTVYVVRRPAGDAA